MARDQRAAGLLTTSTHDTKLGEDARARVSVLSELSDEWGRALSRWRRLARTSRGSHHASIVDPNDVYRFYQAVVGTFPFGPGEPADVEVYADAARRLHAQVDT